VTAASATLAPVADRHGRIKRKLRVSLTDRCNFRCPYCMPETPDWAPRQSLLTNPELGRLLEIFVTRLGITQIRLTGGEPLLRADIAECVGLCNLLRARGLERISLTTNGVLLKRRVETLKVSGLDDVNVSLDALDPAKFHALSGGHGAVEHVLEGIGAARTVGLPVKVNMVVVRGYNDDQILPLTRWACEQDLPLRFIEFMPLDGRGSWSRERVVSETEILDRLRETYTVSALPRSEEPATRYLLDGRHSIGVISTISNPFCRSCDRLRLTATGELYSCLFSANGRNLRNALRQGADDTMLEQVIRAHVWHKEAGYASGGYVERPITMHALGG
jgi:cyclic pyranopterin phosphate synthase